MRHPSGNASTAHRRRLPRLAGLAIGLLLVATAPDIALATGNLQSYPPAYGLQVTLDTRWVDGQGYRPVRVRVVPTVPLTSDRTLSIEFRVRHNWSSQDNLAVRQDLELAAGSPGAEATIAVPDLTGWQAVSVDFFEDGRPLPKLGIPWSGFMGSSSQRELGTMPMILVVTDDGNFDLGQLTAVLPSHFFDARNYVQLPGGRSVPDLANGWMTRSSNAPVRWIDYSSIDLLAVTLGTLETLQQQRPEALRAILDWTAAGGNLLIGGVEPKAESLGRLHQVLGLPRREAVLSQGSGRGWREPDKRLWGREVLAPNDPRYPTEYYVPETPVEASGAPVGVSESPAEEVYEVTVPPGPRITRRPAPAAPPFLLRSFGHGLIAAMGDDRPFPNTREETAWLLNSIGPDRYLWYRRHGMSRLAINPDFWDFLIPGVGLAPVTEFCILITLFVIAIGPVNYWLLRRWKRLHLLVITIPASATAATLALIVYALVADGLGTRVRARSVTCLDQRTGQAACVARLSYYSGLAPSGGLTFSEDTAVLPLEEVPSITTYQNTGPRREMSWAGEQQHLTLGWLASRTPTQFMTVRSHKTDIALDIARRGDGWTAKNRLGVLVRCVVVSGPDGELLRAFDVAPGETAALTKPPDAYAHRAIVDAITAQTLAPPPEMQSRHYGGSLFGLSRSGRRYYRYYAYRSDSTTTPQQTTGRLEHSVRDVRQLALPPNSYIAVVERSPELEHGTASAREEDSLHLVIGQWETPR